MSYAETILSDNPIAYWRFNGSSGTLVRDIAGGHNATLTGSASGHQPGALMTPDSSSTSFNSGTSDAASAAIDLSPYSVITIECWLAWAAFANNDQLLGEYSTNYNVNNAFIIDPNSSTTLGFQWVMSTSAGNHFDATMTRPGGSFVWHQYAATLDRTTPAITCYLDGVKVSTSNSVANSIGGNFSNSTLYFMSRATSSLFGNGNLEEYAIFAGALPASRIAAHYAAARGQYQDYPNRHRGRHR